MLQSSSQNLPFTIDNERIARNIKAQLKAAKEEKYSDWTHIPVFIAAGIFRDLLIQESFISLHSRESDSHITIQQLNRLFSYYVKFQGLTRVQYVSDRNKKALQIGQTIDLYNLLFFPELPLNHNTILRELGVKIHFASFSHPEPTREEVKEQMFRYWKSQ